LPYQRADFIDRGDAVLEMLQCFAVATLRVDKVGSRTGVALNSGSELRDGTICVRHQWALRVIDDELSISIEGNRGEALLVIGARIRKHQRVAALVQLSLQGLNLFVLLDEEYVFVRALLLGRFGFECHAIDLLLLRVERFLLLREFLPGILEFRREAGKL
jgi:hypothetical protein